MLSVVSLWLDYSALTNKLVLSAEDDRDVGVAWALAKMGMAYRDATYQAVRMRVNQVALDLISRPVSEKYTRQTRMKLATVTVRPEGLRMLREFTKLALLVTSRRSPPALSMPRPRRTRLRRALPMMDRLSRSAPRRLRMRPRKRRRRMRLRGRGKKERSVSRSPRPENTPKGPQAPPPTRQAADSRPGANNSFCEAAVPNMDRTIENREAAWGDWRGRQRAGTTAIRRHGPA
jgi:hypothetical protein